MELHYNESNSNNRKIVNKKTFLLFKNKLECEKCGYDRCNSALDFHHIDKSQKDFNMSKVSKIYYNVQDLADEIEEELMNEIVQKTVRVHKLKSWEIMTFRQTIYLGCSPKFKKK